MLETNGDELKMLAVYCSKFLFDDSVKEIQDRTLKLLDGTFIFLSLFLLFGNSASGDENIV